MKEGVRKEAMDFLTCLETPFKNAQPNSPQVVVPTHTLNSVVAAQNNLSNIMKGLVAKRIVNGRKGARSDNEDAPITKRELKHFLHNKKEVSDFMWDIDPLVNVEIMAKPYLTRYQHPPTESLMVLEVQKGTLSPFWMT